MKTLRNAIISKQCVRGFPEKYKWRENKRSYVKETAEHIDLH